MKNGICTLCLSLLFITSHSQNNKFEFPGRINPVINKEKLSKASSIDEIMPSFSNTFGMPYQERKLLNQMLDQQNMFIPGFLIDHRRRIENYNKIMDFVSVEISISQEGNTVVARSASNLLTQDQKNILANADLGSDISIKIKCKFKNAGNDPYAFGNRIIEGRYVVTLVPETEAEYPGGYHRIAEYLTETVINKIAETTTMDKIRQAIIHFTVNEQGQVVDAKISRSSQDSNIDKLILEATYNMPAWKPAQNALGIKVKQEFNIPFGNSGC